MFLSEQIDHTVRQLKSQTANILTLTNLSLGALAIMFIIKDAAHISQFMIFLAALLDRYDGKIARKLNITSEFGKQLDSLCDLLSFGVAPALLLYYGVLQNYGAIGVGVTLLFIICGAVRLARFNVSEFDGNFVGLPITAAGIILTLSYLAIPHLSAYFLLLITLILSYMMVSNISIKKF